MFDPDKNPPKSLQIEINKKCNFKCKMCSQWYDKNTLPELSLTEIKRIIKEFYELNPQGDLILSSGELLLNKNVFFETIYYAKDLGLKTSFVTNGYYIDYKTAEKIINANVHSIAISIDSSDPEIHDYCRGIKGSFKKAVKAINNLVEIKEKTGNKINIYTASIVSKLNINSINEIISLAKKLKIDYVNINMMSDLFVSPCETVGKNIFFEENFFNTKEEKENAKEKLKEIFYKYENDPIFFPKKNELEWINSYIDDPKYILNKPICDAYKKTLIVSISGEAYLCWGNYGWNKAGSVLDNSLKNIWTSEIAYKQRQDLDNCRKNCGANNCNRRDDI